MELIRKKRLLQGEETVRIKESLKLIRDLLNYNKPSKTIWSSHHTTPVYSAKAITGLKTEGSLATLPTKLHHVCHRWQMWRGRIELWMVARRLEMFNKSMKCCSSKDTLWACHRPKGKTTWKTEIVSFKSFCHLIFFYF